MLAIIISVGIGLVFVQLKIFSPKMADTLLKFLMFIAFPAIILSNLSSEHLKELLEINFLLATLVATFAMYGITYLVHKYLFHRDIPHTAFAALSASFVSSGIVGIPLMDHLIGIKASLIPILLNTMLSLVTIVPLTILLVRLKSEHKQNILKTIGLTLFDALKNPLVASSIIGLSIVFFNISLPSWLNLTFSKLGNAAFATALVTIGIGINFKTLKKDLEEILFLTILRVGIFTILGFSIALFFHL